MEASEKTPLDSWMSANGHDDPWLAGVLGCSRSQASRIRRGRSVPSLEAGVAIERITDGAVRPADLLVAADVPEAANDSAAQERAA